MVEYSRSDPETRYTMHRAGRRLWFLTTVCVALGLGSVTMAAREDRWCFQFSWLGPAADNTSLEGNSTCDDINKGPPCYEPLVVTYDGTPPDTSYMWKTYEKEQIATPLARGYSCIKWVVYYDGLVENISYFAGKMIDDDSGPISSGCETQTSGAYTTEVCACSEFLGAPCNAAPRQTAVASLAVLILSAVALLVLGSFSSRINY